MSKIITQFLIIFFLSQFLSCSLINDLTQDKDLKVENDKLKYKIDSLSNEFEFNSSIMLDLKKQNTALNTQVIIEKQVQDSLQIVKDSVINLLNAAGNKLEEQSRQIDSIMVYAKTTADLQAMIIDSLNHNQVKGFENLLILTNNIIVSKIKQIDSSITRYKQVWKIEPYRSYSGE